MYWKHVMPDAFIWYHADEKLEPELVDWLNVSAEKTGVRGKLYIRKQDNKTTFMETYANVPASTIERIEKLAALQPVFTHIERRCESFIEIS